MKGIAIVSAPKFHPSQHSKITKPHMKQYERMKADDIMIQNILNAKSTIMTSSSTGLKGSRCQPISLNKNKKQMCESLKRKQITSQNKKLLERIQRAKSQVARERIRYFDSKDYGKLKQSRNQFRRRVRKERQNFTISQNEILVKRLIHAKSQYSLSQKEINDRYLNNSCSLVPIIKRKSINCKNSSVRAKTQLSQIYLQRTLKTGDSNSESRFNNVSQRNPQNRKRKFEIGQIQIRAKHDKFPLKINSSKIMQLNQRKLKNVNNQSRMSQLTDDVAKQSNTSQGKEHRRHSSKSIILGQMKDYVDQKRKKSTKIKNLTPIQKPNRYEEQDEKQEIIKVSLD